MVRAEEDIGNNRDYHSKREIGGGKGISTNVTHYVVTLGRMIITRECKNDIVND